MSAAVSFPDRGCVHQLVEAQALRTPLAVAAEFREEYLTYAALDERGTKFANHLLASGVMAGSRVAVCLERSLDPIIVFLGILKAGSAYVPLDPDLPPERLTYMLEDCGAAALVIGSSQIAKFANYSGVTVDIGQSAPAIASKSPRPQPCEVLPDNLAYVIYTSGSTGKPKGVMIPHKAVVNFLHSMRQEPGLTRNDSIMAITTFSFDIAVLELFLPLIVGGRVIIADRDTAGDVRNLAAALAVRRPTVMQATPTTWRMLIGGGWPGNKRLKALCGGEALSRDLAEELLERVGSLWNMYGPTETTVWSLIHRVHSGSGVVPIGRPIANTKIYVLDAHGAPAPVGVTGKLYISGEGLALGYNNRPELTSEKFVVSPLPECGGERIYDTGDLARCQADGCVEWQGRADNQVKIRGYRIELEEIESVLRRHKGVSEAVVVVRTGSLLAGHSGDDRRLAAYLLPSGPAVPSSSDIRRHTARFLPDYMVPSAFIFLDTLPLTPNGKVDRNAMPEPDAASHRDSGRETIGPNSPLEATLLRIFEQVLTVSPLSVTDDFFESGGNSLLAYQLVSGIVRHTGHDIPLAALFQAPTVRKLARKLEDRTYDDAWSALVELRKGNGSGAEPLFCTHWLDAELFTFHRIASLLRDDRPVYGLQATAPESPESPIIGIKAMAAAYARQIRSCYPHGPYNLAGSCLGGVVAFETARQLVAAGERVGLLILIDAFMPGPLQYLHTRPYLLEQMDRYCGEFLLSPAAAMKRWARESVTRLAGTVRGQGTYSRVSGRLRKLSAEAEERYRPEPYSGKVTLLICSDGPSRAYEDRRLGWAAVADGGFEVHVVPGNHSTMEQEPNIQVIAERIQRCFDASSDLKAVNTSVAAAGVVLPRRLRFQEETK